MDHAEHDPKTDAALVYEVVNGETELFGELIARYKNVLASFIAARVARGAIEDLAQETFLRAFRVLATLRDPAAFSSWLLGIASHICVDWHRSRRRNVSLDASEIDQPDDAAAPRRTPPIRPDEAAEKREAEQRLLEAVDRLPDTYRTTLVLKHLEGLSCADIAERQGVALGTVTSRLTRGYRMLREALGDETA